MADHIHLDPVGGIAGDMFIAALLDVWPDMAAELVASIHAAGLSDAVKIHVWRDRDAVLTGSRFRVDQNASTSSEGHRHTHFHDIRVMLKGSSLASAVTDRAVDIFRILAEAEASVHGVPVDDVAFHEVGATDSIADIVGAAYLIDALDGTTWSCGPLPMGSGRVQTEHGLLPLPAPAVALLLTGCPVYQDGIEGERVTPTGAAIVRHLDPDFSDVRPAMRLIRSGTGLGTRTFPGISNTLRVLVSEAIEHELLPGDVAVMQFEVDDQSPEDLAIGLNHVRAQSGVLDVIQTAVFGKKGRLATQVQILVRPDAVDSVASACFKETNTTGLRWQLSHRKILPRRIEELTVDEQIVRVKYVDRPDGSTTEKVEADDLAHLEGGRAARKHFRRKAEQAPTFRIEEDE
jgi:hypothetical protein